MVANPQNDRLYQHLLLLDPDKKVTEEINEFKKYFTEHYSCKKAAGLKPHITLVKFEQLESAQHRIVQHLNKFTQSFVLLRLN